jgi:DNA-directed RNA polymerase specialized sigma24 family protein
MIDDKLGQQISRKLSALIALALTPDAEKKSSAEKVALLARFDLPNQEVADILGTTKGTVEVLKSRGGKRRK